MVTEAAVTGEEQVVAKVGVVMGVALGVRGVAREAMVVALRDPVLGYL